MNSPNKNHDLVFSTRDFRSSSANNRERYWKSVEELAKAPELQRLLEREFVPGASDWPAQIDRRSFLNLMAASLALAGATGCTRQPLEEIVPYVRQPEEITLGKPLYFATAMPLGGFGTGILVKSREGRPIKADGNPLHPASLGGSNVWVQACLLDLYDPDRAKAVTYLGQPNSWPVFLSALHDSLKEQRKKHGAGLRILAETITSPTLGSQLKAVLKEFPDARWHQYEPVNRDNAMAGSQMAFGEYVAAHYNFQKAKIILSLDSDFLHAHPDRLRYARHFTDGRRVVTNSSGMNRLYLVEPTPSITGAMADHRLAASSKEIETLARELARELGISTATPAVAISQNHREWLSVMANELRAHRGECLVIVGEFQSPSLHALGHALNETLGNVGQTVHYTAPAEFAPVLHTQSLSELVQEMDRGRAELLVIIGGNPVFNAPADFEFARHLKKVKASVHLALAPNETSSLSAWNIPRAHFLETWSDIRSFDGTATIMQPLIAPLFDGHSEHELLEAMLPLQPQRSSYDIVRASWRERNFWPDFEKGWRRAVHDGVVETTASQQKNLKLQPSIQPIAPDAAKGTLEISFRPDPNLWDGQFGNNPWLHELPKPISKLTWDNAVLVSPGFAEREKLLNGDLIELSAGGRTVAGAVLILPGQADNFITLHLGYGRTDAGRGGRNVGFNFYRLRASAALWSADGGTIKKTGRRHELVRTQLHHRLQHEDRQIHRTGTFEQWRANPTFVQDQVIKPAREETLYNAGDFDGGRKWGMSIDLGACIGCNACVMACNIENNIPVVGKKQVALSREMLWLRIDTYFKGSIDNPEIFFEPVPCMHCENAPCEYVCPVEAAIHDHEGLNLQVYNRCVGTRYCSNNCPYKVRRFNFLHYANPGPLEALGQNPEVTVRSRGVMEKCTYCVQRIAAARIEAEKENRPIRDGEVRTACQEACPANAIVFGVMTDPESTVARYKKHPLDFSMLGQLNTRPRTTYLAKISNPNPRLKTESAREEEEPKV